MVACEFSQVVCKAFRERGHEAYSCDILPTEGKPEWHIQDDVLKHLDDGWDLMIAHPPCTYLTNSGVRWLIDNPERYALMVSGCKFFNELLNARVPMIAVENPIPHKYARQFIPVYQQLIQPKHFDEPESKATCLWLKGLPPLMASVIHTKVNQSIFREPPSPERWKNRSRTFNGIAKAMAEQWGNQ